MKKINIDKNSKKERYKKEKRSFKEEWEVDYAFTTQEDGSLFSICKRNKGDSVDANMKKITKTFSVLLYLPKCQFKSKTISRAKVFSS